MNHSLNQTLLTLLLYVSQTWLTQLIPGNFSVRGYLPLIWKDFTTHVHDLPVYVKEGLPFAQDLSLENSLDSYLFFPLALLHSVSYFFFLNQSPTLFLCTVFDSISSNIYEDLFINPSAVFVFGDLNIHHNSDICRLFRRLVYRFGHPKNTFQIFFSQLQSNKNSVKAVINDFIMHLIISKWIRIQKWWQRC